MLRTAGLLALLLGTTPVQADGSIRVRAYVEPEGPVFTGQQVRLNIEVQTDTWFTTAPRYPELELRGAIALMPDAFGINSTTREGGKTWAGQTRRFVLFPQRSGSLEIPPIEISLAVAQDGKAGPSTTVTSPAVVIPVVAPPGSADAAEFVSSPDYRLSAEWDRNLDNLKVGDAISLRVTQTADEVFALTVPAIEFPEIEGLARYSSRPVLDDRNYRGRVSTVRTDRVTYVLQQQGDFTIPEITTFWFDLGDNTMKKRSLEATSISVAANPDAALGIGEAADDNERLESLARTALDWLVANLPGISILIGVLYAVVRAGKTMVIPALARWRRRRRAWQLGEEAYFRKLLAAVRAGDPAGVVAGFWRWSDRLPGRGIPLSIDGLRRASTATAFDGEWRDIELARYRHADAAGQRKAIRRLGKSLGALRTNWFAARSGPESRSAADRSSGPLNP